MMEILVVTAILLVLFALMFPVTKASMAKANRVKCLANLRQIGVALIQYAGDHSGVSPTRKARRCTTPPSL